MREELAHELRALRTSADLSARVLAQRLRMSASKLSRIERGRSAVSERDVASIVDYFDVRPGKREELILKARRIAQGIDLDATVSFDVIDERDLKSIEEGAHETVYLSLNLVSGLLQSAEYVEAVMRWNSPDASEDEIVARTRLRLERQSVLIDTRRRFRFLMREDVLCADLVTPAQMENQLDHLLYMASRPNVSVEFIPASRARSANLTGFTMYDNSLMQTELSGRVNGDWIKRGYVTKAAILIRPQLALLEGLDDLTVKEGAAESLLRRSLATAIDLREREPAVGC